MGRPAGWMQGLTGRAPMKSPGAPAHRREVERLFWRDVTNKADTGSRSRKVLPDKVDRTGTDSLLSLVSPRRWMTAHKPFCLHDVCHSFLTTLMSISGELSVNAPVPVGAVRRLEHPDHLDRQPFTYLRGH